MITTVCDALKTIFGPNPLLLKAKSPIWVAGKMACMVLSDIY
jgi:hypothetical protein